MKPKSAKKLPPWLMDKKEVKEPMKGKGKSSKKSPGSKKKSGTKAAC